MKKLASTSAALALFASAAMSQAVPITDEMRQYSPNSITGVYVCTPQHVTREQCSDVDDEYYVNLARISLGSYEIGVLEFEDFDAVAFRGPFSFGSADKIIEIIQETRITKLALASVGGIPEEAFQLADWIKENNIQTWVPRNRGCLSACSYVFLNGVDPILDGVLGMHQYQYNVFDTFQFRTLEQIQQQVRNITQMNGEIHIRHMELFVQNGWDIDVLKAMHQMEGDFVKFESLDELVAFDDRSAYTAIELGNISRNQSERVYGFVNYTPLFTTF